MAREWYHIENTDKVHSPSVLVYPDRIQENITRMVTIAGGVDRLRPHVKTHKLPQVVRDQVERGITRFKCATLSELEMVAQNGGEDLLLAYPLVGPAVGGFIDLMQAYPMVKFSALADDMDACRVLEQQAESAGVTLRLLVDIDNGMGRTGIAPGEDAQALYRYISESEHLMSGGLHVYDGHIHTEDPDDRKADCDRDFAPVLRLIEVLEDEGLSIPELIAGGTPTFPVHAEYPDRILSPGTVILWDYGYGSRYTDLEFVWAAVLFTRVVSRPGANRVCLDLGHKAVAAEKPPPRVYFPGREDVQPETHSEEHLVLSGPGVQELKVGDSLYGIPQHICPTMALHDEVYVVRDQRVEEKWEVTARRRRY